VLVLKLLLKLKGSWSLASGNDVRTCVWGRKNEGEAFYKVPLSTVPKVFRQRRE